jgi:PKD repeat protein
MKLHYRLSFLRTPLLETAVLALLIGSVPNVNAQADLNVRLPAPARGNAAISALAAHLPEVARAYGLDAQGLTTLLRTQPSLGTDKAGVLFFACDGLANAAAGAGSASVPMPPSNATLPNSSVAQIASGAVADAFQLHSFPGAGRLIYLDFTGHVTSGTAWNSNVTGGATINSQAFDLDGDPSSFNEQERTLIQSVWQRVAEDYAPFAIDVTTQDPGTEALRRTTSSDSAYGVRVVITPSNWYNSSAGGVGYIGSFSWNSDTPCFVFSNSLANHAKYIAEAAAHEAGHAVGLYHDGASGTEYYSGQGIWAPIMGVGYYRPLTEFSKGEYTGANNSQDDFAVIATHAPLASDHHGNTLETAKVLSGPAVADGGTIETRTDVDVFRFDAASGQVSLNVVSPAPEANLHIKAELLNSAGQVLQSNDATSLTASFTTTLAGGTYYLRVSGVGAGDPYSAGYSDYGSVGNYVITGSITSMGTKQNPIAAVSASKTSGPAPLTVDFSSAGSTDPDGYIASHHWNFGNGVTSAAMSPTYTFPSSGTFPVLLTVTDNDGLQGAASITISVTASANQTPVAVISATPSSGVAPLPVSFSSAGSIDPDGSIVSYSWDFGDGTTSTEVSPNKTYNAAGSYAARLTVTDNVGATASSNTTILVGSGNDRNNDIDVTDYSLTTTTANKGTSAIATVEVRNRLNMTVAGANVTVQWSGLISTTSSGSTNANGTVVLTSRSTKRAGTIIGTIVSVSAPSGSAYDSAISSEPLVNSVQTN